MNRNWKEKLTSYALCCNDDSAYINNGVFLEIFHSTQGLLYLAPTFSMARSVQIKGLALLFEGVPISDVPCRMVVMLRLLCDGNFEKFPHQGTTIQMWVNLHCVQVSDNDGFP